ncbi:response regulator [Bosea sp. 685]|uniref:response regulator n=1 Tax=Bosea sp. 685 TaxID=3080057 RepID=UPI0028935B5A|nr:response regulator [Bosea sp. 685]WNJ88648.1 response regulator [Bosea sp. 685]
MAQDLGHLKVALLDDDPIFRELAAAMLQAGGDFSVEKSQTSDGLIDAIERTQPDCIMLDYDLGDDNGLNVLQRLIDYFPNLPPVIMVTGDGKERTVIKALRLGVSDYLTKRDLDGPELASTVKKCVRKSRQERASELEHNRLAKFAGVDPTTKLANDVAINARLRQLSALTAQARANYAIVSAEIEFYDEIIGKIGLSKSDKIVSVFSDALKLRVRSEDIVGYYGSGKFIIITNVANSISMLDNICAKISEYLSFTVNFDDLTLSFSGKIGACLCDDKAAIGVLLPADLIAPANAALAAIRGTTDKFRVAERPSGQTTSSGAGASPDRGTATTANVSRTTDRRREPRQRVYKKGSIVIEHLNATIDCVVRDMSTGGARLRVAMPFSLPETFRLIIAGAHGARKVALRWQNGTDFGVEYL